MSHGTDGWKRWPAVADLAYGRAGELAQRWAGIWRHLEARVDGVRMGDLSEGLCRAAAMRRLTLGVSNVCNARCRFCTYGRAAGDRNRRAAVMPLELGRELIERYARAGGRHVDFTSPLGEPLLCPWLPQLVKHARGCGVERTSLVSNGVKLHEEGLAEELVGSGLTQITISSGDFDRETYALVMGMDRFMDLCRGLDRLLSARRRRAAGLKVVLCIRNALRPSHTLRSGAFGALVAPHGDIELHFTLSFDSWGGTVPCGELLGGMRERRDPPLMGVPCQGLFQPAVLPDGQFRLCPCRAAGSEFDGLLAGSDWDALPGRMMAACGEFFAGRMPGVCRRCGMYRPVTRGWLSAYGAWGA